VLAREYILLIKCFFCFLITILHKEDVEGAKYF